jgi:hypothetical protein
VRWISNTGQAFVAGNLDAHWRLDRERRAALVKERG